MYDPIGDIISKHNNENHNLPQMQKVRTELTQNKDDSYNVNWNLLNNYGSTDKRDVKDFRKIINNNIQIKGFMLPIEYSVKKITEFLLIPYVPTCAHVPPPPANMIIKVKMQKTSGIKAEMIPVQVKGKLQLSKKTNKKALDPLQMEGTFVLLADSVKEVANQ